MQANLSIKPTILLVDDVPANLRALSDLLSTQYSLKFATSGLQALQILKSSPLPDIVLLDVMMPDMDGYTVCQEIRRWVTTQHIPVIFVTALDEDNDEMLGLEVGADDYIIKPFKPEIVLARIRNQLRCRAATSTIVLEPSPPKSNVLMKQGLTWHISFQGNPAFYLPDRQGLGYLKVLLTYPGQEFTVEELVFLVVPKERERLLTLMSERIGAQRTKLLDAYAESECAALGLTKQSKTDSVTGISASQLFDIIRHERGFENDPALVAIDRERFRKSISIAIRRTIEDISRFDPALSSHLQSPTLKLGLKLIYLPNPMVSWVN